MHYQKSPKIEYRNQFLKWAKILFTINFNYKPKRIYTIKTNLYFLIPLSWWDPPDFATHAEARQRVRMLTFSSLCMVNWAYYKHISYQATKRRYHR
jgi:hypothetical protein